MAHFRPEFEYLSRDDWVGRLASLLEELLNGSPLGVQPELIVARGLAALADLDGMRARERRDRRLVLFGGTKKAEGGIRRAA